MENPGSIYLYAAVALEAEGKWLGPVIRCSAEMMDVVESDGVQLQLDSHLTKQAVVRLEAFEKLRGRI